MLSHHLFASSAICAITGSLAVPWGPQHIFGQLRAFDQASCAASRESATLDLAGAPGCRRLPGDWVAGSIQLDEAQGAAARSPVLAYLYTDAACRQGGRRLLPGRCVDDLSDKVWRSYVVMGSRNLELRQEEEEEERTLDRRQKEEEEEELALARRQEEEEERTVSRRQEEEEEERTITRRQEEEEEERTINRRQEEEEEEQTVTRREEEEEEERAVTRRQEEEEERTVTRREEEEEEE